jgi:hypothetical protein
VLRVTQWLNPGSAQYDWFVSMTHGSRPEDCSHARRADKRRTRACFTFSEGTTDVAIGKKRLKECARPITMNGNRTATVNVLGRFEGKKTVDRNSVGARSYTVSNAATVSANGTRCLTVNGQHSLRAATLVGELDAIASTDTAAARQPDSL